MAIERKKSLIKIYAAQIDRVEKSASPEYDHDLYLYHYLSFLDEHEDSLPDELAYVEHAYGKTIAPGTSECQAALACGKTFSKAFVTPQESRFFCLHCYREAKHFNFSYMRQAAAADSIALEFDGFLLKLYGDSAKPPVMRIAMAGVGVKSRRTYDVTLVFYSSQGFFLFEKRLLLPLPRAIGRKERNDISAPDYNLEDIHFLHVVINQGDE